ncbi:MAG: thioredoxin fold domain-containing protein [Xanthomonadales bacterium]|nr:thioredoxin fold domain-containing protein [Xanthomonadales bacterium]
MQRTKGHTTAWACGWLLAAGTASLAFAQEEPATSAIETKIRNLAPGVSSIAISETPIDGILQVQVDNEIYYASDDAKYLVIGRIMDMDTRVNITDQAKSALRKDALANLDEAQHISFSPAEPQHELLVFTDIDCGYCRKLHTQIEEYMAEGIAIHYLAFPRAGSGSHSFEKFVSVWCADDQQAALTLAKSGEEPAPLQCENPIEDQYKLGVSIGITGTPALVTADGTLIPGYMPPAQLKERLEAIETQVAQAD